jgi:transcription antitermination factor NusG
MLMGETCGNLAEVREQALGMDTRPIGSATEDRRWYMVLARPGHELEAVDSFRRNGVRAYWPNYEKIIATRARRNGRAVPKVIVCGIVPGYLFSPGSQVEDFEGLIERITGAINFVRTFSGDPLFLREDDIAIIRRIETAQNTPSPKGAAHRFVPGDHVRFADDMHGRWPTGTVAKLERGGRIVVEVELMGRKTPVSVFQHQIDRV